MTYRGLGFDPTPGSVDAVTSAITQLRAVADALSAAADGVRAAAGHASNWQGAAADAFRARATVPADTAPLREAIPVLERWAETLAANKRRTEELDARARRLRQGLDDARDSLQDRQNDLDLAATSAAVMAAGAAVRLAEERVRAAEVALQAVLSEAHGLADEHLRAADEAAVALGATPAPRSGTVRALAGVLARSSRTAAALGALVTPGEFTMVSPGAVASVQSPPFHGTGEMIELSETPL